MENDDAAIAAMAEDAFVNGKSAGSHCDCRKAPFLDGYIRGYKKGRLEGHDGGYKTGFEDGYIHAAHGPHLKGPKAADGQSVTAPEQPESTEAAADSPDNSSATAASSHDVFEQLRDCWLPARTPSSAKDLMAPADAVDLLSSPGQDGSDTNNTHSPTGLAPSLEPANPDTGRDMGWLSNRANTNPSPAAAPARAPSPPVALHARTTSPKTTRYGIPPPHLVRPTTPDFARDRGPRPPYPALAPPYDVTTPLTGMAAEMSEDPWRVLVSPLGEPARLASAASAGGGHACRTYWRRKLRGVVLCDLQTGPGGSGGEDPADPDVVWYVVVMFETPALAREALEVVRAYPCGGSIMWSWIFREA